MKQEQTAKPVIGKGNDIPQGSSKKKWIIIAIIVIAVVAGLYFWLA